MMSASPKIRKRPIEDSTSIINSAGAEGKQDDFHDKVLVSPPKISKISDVKLEKVGYQ